MAKYSIGVDYGTQSGRAVVIDVSNGKELASAVTEYRAGVIDHVLEATGERLPQDWALEDVDDYLEVLFTAVPEAVRLSGVDKEDIIGLGIDFTACTLVPVDDKGYVLCQQKEYRQNKHSWCKLWKHHAAQKHANDINRIAAERGETFLGRYGNKLSSEWAFAKIWQILDEAPEIYDATYEFMEATDWITMQCTGEWVKNSCTAGYKEVWSKEDGYPSKDFLKALDTRLENMVEEKLKVSIKPIGSKAGELLPAMADKMGLKAGIAIAVGNVDAHVSAPAVNVVKPGQMLMIMGTSVCDILISDVEKVVPGICGVAADGAIPGYYAYESGQSAVGDIYEWFIKNCVPQSYMDEAKERDINIHVLLTEKASKLKPGESGLLALDWWNGNRSCLVDVDLTGMILGMNLLTKPEEIYRALIEATAFGKKLIVENYKKYGVPVNELFACGGLSQKNKMLMQIWADCINMEIKVSESIQTPALGAALFGALAAGKEAGGFDDIFEAANTMSRLKEESFKPIPENVAIYEKLFVEFEKLHDYFGRGENDVMKVLKNIKKNS